MTITRINRLYAPIKKFLPSFFSIYLRRIVTALITPISFSLNSGHFKSSIKERAVDKNGIAVPWLTYPCTNFLSIRNLSEKSVLEFGGGQSTIYFSKSVKDIITFEEDSVWAKYLSDQKLTNSTVYDVPSSAAGMYVDQEIINTIGEEQKSFVKKILDQNHKNKKFNIILIDGLIRDSIIDICQNYLHENGVIICDDAGGYNFEKAMRNSELYRVDFYGHSPGVYHHTCTSMFFTKDCDLFSSSNKIVNNLYSK
tara:strand:+ start:64 stop:825 length:762 start_codon:yes stop_codon:yes gene_type:complete